MAWQDLFVGNQPGLSDQDRQQLARSGLLQAGLQALALNNSRQATPGQALATGLLGGIQGAQQSGQDLVNDRYRQQQMQYQQAQMADQQDQMQRRRQIQDLALRFAKPDGAFDMQGYQQALSQIDPQAAMELHQNELKGQLMQAQAAKATSEARAKAVRQIPSGNNIVTQEQQEDGSWKVLATAPRWEPQQSASSALSQQIALMRKFGATDDDIRAKLGIQPQGQQNQQDGLTGQDYLNSLSERDRNMVQAVVEGRYPVPTGRQAMSPQWQSLIAAAQQVDPTLDAGSYKSRAAARQSFTSGKASQEIKALNTLAGHIQTLSDSLDQMGNSDISLLNRGSNFLGQEFGGKRGQALASFNTAAKAVGDEAAKVFAGGQSALGDRQEIAHSLNPNAPNSNLRATLQTYSDLVQSRLAALQDQANQSLGYGSKSIQVVTPKAAKTFQRFAGGQAPSTPAQIDLNQKDPLGLGL